MVKINIKTLLVLIITFVAIMVNGQSSDRNKNVATSGLRSANLAGTVIIPASHFLDEIPKGNIITDAAAQHTEWLFNNTALILKSETNLMTHVTIPEDGSYYLFVRSQGQNGSSFKVAINDKVTDSIFGKSVLNWKQGGLFNLRKGMINVKITRIDPGSLFDVLVLTKNTSLKEDEIIPYQLNDDVKLLKEYKIPQSNVVKFGDVNGDGLTDFMVLEPDFSSHIFDNSVRSSGSGRHQKQTQRKDQNLKPRECFGILIKMEKQR